MANLEKDPGHTKFFLAVRQKDGQPFGMRFDPAIFYDPALKTILQTQINHVLQGNGSVKIISSDSKGETRKIEMTSLSLSETIKTEKDPLEELFAEITRPDVVKVVIIQEQPAAEKFVEKEMRDEKTTLPPEEKTRTSER